jgi:hypothetical protein
VISYDFTVVFQALNLGVEMDNHHSIPVSQNKHLSTFRRLKAPTSGHSAQLAALKFPGPKKKHISGTPNVAYMIQ